MPIPSYTSKLFPSASQRATGKTKPQIFLEIACLAGRESYSTSEMTEDRIKEIYLIALCGPLPAV